MTQLNMHMLAKHTCMLHTIARIHSFIHMLHIQKASVCVLRLSCRLVTSIFMMRAAELLTGRCCPVVNVSVSFTHKQSGTALTLMALW